MDEYINLLIDAMKGTAFTIFSMLKVIGVFCVIFWTTLAIAAPISWICGRIGRLVEKSNTIPKRDSIYRKH